MALGIGFTGRHSAAFQISMVNPCAVAQMVLSSLGKYWRGRGRGGGLKKPGTTSTRYRVEIVRRSTFTLRRSLEIIDRKRPESPPSGFSRSCTVQNRLAKNEGFQVEAGAVLGVACSPGTR